MEIKRLTADYEQAWNDYVRTHDKAVFSQMLGWRDVVQRIYGLKPLYLLAEENSAIKGILPLFIMKHWYFGRKLISMPFSVSGGVCAESSEIENRLIEEAIQITKDTNLDYLELRHFQKREGNLTTFEKYYTFLIKLQANSDEVWKNIRRDSRRCIRRGLEQNFQIEMNTRDVAEFYKIYSIGQRDLGTPVSGYNWIKTLFDAFPENHRIARIKHEGKTIAVLSIREFKDTVYPTVGYALKEYRNLYPMYVLYWKLIEESCERGFKWYDFGRSIKESGTFKFKTWWGAEPVPLYYQFYFHKSKKIPDTSQSQPTRQRFAKIWQKMPLSVANTVGPMIRKYYP